MKRIFLKRDIGISAALLILITAAFIFPVSAAFSDAVPAASLIPVGRTTGIKFSLDGAVITGFPTNEYSPAKEGGLNVGDVIVSVDGSRVCDNRTLSMAIEDAQDPELNIDVIRDGEKRSFCVDATVDQEGNYVLGVFLRDTLAGIGTITFIDPESGEYGALGHGISDPDTMSLAQFSKGTLMPSKVISVKRGKDGAPGELMGSFDMAKEQGIVSSNTESGIFGRLSNPESFCSSEALETVPISDVKTGKAYILSNVNGTETRKYEIEIMNVYKDDSNMRQMLLKVTDKELIETTGGIVQGMSGSPIIQNGKLVGAVTHVLINDSTKGYGIGIETMLKASKAA